jgi:hypothetical protein
MAARSQTERVENPFSRTSEAGPALADVEEPIPAAAANFTKRTPEGTASRVPEPELALRALTGYEEAYIEAHLAAANTARLVNDVIARCLGAPEADTAEALDRVRGLLIADRDAALVRLRRLSLGDEIRTAVDCPDCATTSEVSFELAQLSTDFNRPLAEIEAKLPDGRSARLRLPTAGDQEALFDAALETASERRSWLISRLLISLGDEVGPFDDRFAHGLPVAIRGAIEESINRASPDLDLSMSVDCRNCEAQFAVPFDVASFFLRK